MSNIIGNHVKGFYPIQHNLLETDNGFDECQAYNMHLVNNGWKQGNTLKEKIDNERRWKARAQLLLDIVKGVKV